MKILFVFVMLAFVAAACHKNGSNPGPTPPAKPTVTFDSASPYSPNASGTPIEGTFINFTVKVYEENQIDSIVLIDETNPTHFTPLVLPQSAHYKITDHQHPYPSDDTYHLTTYVSDRTTITSPSFKGK